MVDWDDFFEKKGSEKESLNVKEKKDRVYYQEQRDR